VPAVREAPVGGDDEADSAGFPRPLHTGRDRIAAAEPVDLEEELRVGGDDLFDRLARERRKAHRRATCGGSARNCNLAVRMNRLHASWRDQYWQRNILSHNGCRQIALLQSANYVGCEAELGERVDVVRD